MTAPLVSQPAVRPNATPVDSFVSPRIDSSLQETIQALSGLSGSVQRAATIVGRQEDEAAFGRGRDAFRKLELEGLTAADYEEAVKRGIIQREDNPFFMAGLERQAGIIAAHKAYTDFQAWFAQQPEAESTDPADFDAAMRKAAPEFIKKYSAGLEGSRFFQAGFQQFDALMLSERNEFVNRVRVNRDRAADDGTYTAVDAVLHAPNVSLVEKVAKIQENLDAMYSVNKPGASRMLDKATEAILDYAIEQRDPEIAKQLLEQVVTGSGTLAGRELARKKLLELPGIIGRLTEQDRVLAQRQERQEAEQTKERLQTTLAERLRQGNYTTNDLEREALALGDLGIPIAADLRRTAEAFKNPAEENDEEVIRRLSLGITDPRNPIGVQEVRNALAAKQIRPADFWRLMGEIEQRDRQHGSGSSFSAAYKSQPIAMHGDFSSVVGAAGGNYDKPAFRELQTQLELEFARMAYLWLNKNPDADPIQQLEAGMKTRKLLLDQAKARFPDLRDGLSETAGADQIGAEVSGKRAAVPAARIMEAILDGRTPNTNDLAEIRKLGIPPTLEALQQYLKDQQ